MNAKLTAENARAPLTEAKMEISGTSMSSNVVENGIMTSPINRIAGMAHSISVQVRVMPY